MTLSKIQVKEMRIKPRQSRRAAMQEPVLPVQPLRYTRAKTSLVLALPFICHISCEFGLLSPLKSSE